MRFTITVQSVYLRDLRRISFSQEAAVLWQESKKNETGLILTALCSVNIVGLLRSTEVLVSTIE
jgi:hypothetical protein